jgi:hypothetical protein
LSCVLATEEHYKGIEAHDFFGHKQLVLYLEVQKVLLYQYAFGGGERDQ